MKRATIIGFTAILIDFPFLIAGMGQDRVVRKVSFLQLPQRSTQYKIAKDRRVLQIEGERPSQRLTLLSKEGVQSKVIMEAQRIFAPQFSPDESKVSFGFRDATRINKICIYDLQKEKKTIIERTGLHVGALSFSPSEGLVAYAVQQERQDGKSRYDVVIDNYDLSLGIRIAEGHFPEWSPDGTRLSFQRSEQDQVTGRWISYIWLVDKYGKNEKKLLSSRGCRRLTWSPMGKFSTAPNGYNISIVDVEKDTSIKIGSYCADNPSWSPDGKKLAFYQPHFEEPVEEGILAGGDIFIINADGSDLINLTNNPRHQYTKNPVWLSPDEIAVEVYESGRTIIEILTVE